MINPIDGFRLARTKLRTRRIRLATTVIISSLLFAVLAFLGALTEGVVRSLNSFSKEGYGQRYFVQASPVMYSGVLGEDASIIDSLRPVQRDLIAQKKTTAKKLNITYDENTDQTLPLQISKGMNGATDTYLNFMSKVVIDLMNARNRDIPGSDYESFAKVAKTAGSVATYQSTAGISRQMGAPGTASGTLTVLIAGKETPALRADNINAINGINSITQTGWRGADEALIQPFILPGQTMAVKADGSIPVVAPYGAAEEILGLKPLPQTASTEQKLSRLVEVRKGIAGHTAQICFRNGTSADLFAQAIQQQKEIEANKSNKEYVKPSLIYQVPDKACGEVTIKSDTRNAEEKKQAATQRTFDTQFGNYTEPTQGIVNIRIIGISREMNTDYSLSASSILTSLLGSSMGDGWVSPLKALSDNPITKKAQGGSVNELPRGSVQYYAEFQSLANAKAFIAQQTCDEAITVNTGGGNVMVVTKNGPPTADLAAACANSGKPFTVSPYGNSAGAVEEFRKAIWKFARIAILIIIGIASLVMMGNVGKIIADGRRETAVFRSLGAKRFDISQIYLTYTVLLCALITLCAVTIGSVAAYLLSAHYSPNLSVSAVIIYNAQDIHTQFVLYGLNPMYIAAIAGIVLVAGLISSGIPLLTNMRRNPIRDMRDDS